MRPSMQPADPSGRLMALEGISKCDGFQLDPDGIHDRNHGPRFEHKSGQHRAEFVHGQRIVAIQQHISAPVAHSNDEHLDLEIVRGPSIE